MIPDPATNRDAKPPGGAGGPARDGTYEPSRAAGHVQCCICLGLIPLDQYRTARCWMDPEGKTCAAHAHCLRRVGEREIGLA